MGRWWERGRCSRAGGPLGLLALALVWLVGAETMAQDVQGVSVAVVPVESIEASQIRSPTTEREIQEELGKAIIEAVNAFVPTRPSFRFDALDGPTFRERVVRLDQQDEPSNQATPDERFYRGIIDLCVNRNAGTRFDGRLGVDFIVCPRLVHLGHVRGFWLQVEIYGPQLASGASLLEGKEIPSIKTPQSLREHVSDVVERLLLRIDDPIPVFQWTYDSAQRALAGDVLLHSYPPGAEVRVDGELVGTTPLRQSLGHGRHEVLLSMQGYKTEVRTFELGDGAPPDVWTPHLVPLGITLSMTSEPTGAEVRCNERLVGVTPFEKVFVPHDGRSLARLQITRQGYSSRVVDVQIAPGEVLEEHIKLQSAPATILVRTDLPNMTVEIDGKRQVVLEAPGLHAVDGFHHGLHVLRVVPGSEYGEFIRYITTPSTLVVDFSARHLGLGGFEALTPPRGRAVAMAHLERFEEEGVILRFEAGIHHAINADHLGGAFEVEALVLPWDQEGVGQVVSVGLGLGLYGGDRFYRLTDSVVDDLVSRLRLQGSWGLEGGHLRFGALLGVGVLAPLNALSGLAGVRLSFKLPARFDLSSTAMIEPTAWRDVVEGDVWTFHLGLGRRF